MMSNLSALNNMDFLMDRHAGRRSARTLSERACSGLCCRNHSRSQFLTSFNVSPGIIENKGNTVIIKQAAFRILLSPLITSSLMSRSNDLHLRGPKFTVNL